MTIGASNDSSFLLFKSTEVSKSIQFRFSSIIRSTQHLAPFLKISLSSVNTIQPKHRIPSAFTRKFEFRLATVSAGDVWLACETEQETLDWIETLTRCLLRPHHPPLRLPVNSPTASIYRNPSFASLSPYPRPSTTTNHAPTQAPPALHSPNQDYSYPESADSVDKNNSPSASESSLPNLVSTLRPIASNNLDDYRQQMDQQLYNKDEIINQLHEQLQQSQRDRDTWCLQFHDVLKGKCEVEESVVGLRGEIARLQQLQGSEFGRNSFDFTQSMTDAIQSQLGHIVMGKQNVADVTLPRLAPSLAPQKMNEGPSLASNAHLEELVRTRISRIENQLDTHFTKQFGYEEENLAHHLHFQKLMEDVLQQANAFQLLSSPTITPHASTQPLDSRYSAVTVTSTQPLDSTQPTAKAIEAISQSLRKLVEFATKTMEIQSECDFSIQEKLSRVLFDLQAGKEPLTTLTQQFQSFLRSAAKRESPHSSGVSAPALLSLKDSIQSLTKLSLDSFEFIRKSSTVQSLDFLTLKDASSGVLASFDQLKATQPELLENISLRVKDAVDFSLAPSQHSISQLQIQTSALLSTERFESFESCLREEMCELRKSCDQLTTHALTTKESPKDFDAASTVSILESASEHSPITTRSRSSSPRKSAAEHQVVDHLQTVESKLNQLNASVLLINRSINSLQPSLDALKTSSISGTGPLTPLLPNSSSSSRLDHFLDLLEKLPPTTFTTRAAFKNDEIDSIGNAFSPAQVEQVATTISDQIMKGFAHEVESARKSMQPHHRTELLDNLQTLRDDFSREMSMFGESLRSLLQDRETLIQENRHLRLQAESNVPAPASTIKEESGSGALSTLNGQQGDDTCARNVMEMLKHHLNHLVRAIRQKAEELTEMDLKHTEFTAQLQRSEVRSKELEATATALRHEKDRLRAGIVNQVQLLALIKKIPSVAANGVSIPDSASTPTSQLLSENEHLKMEISQMKDAANSSASMTALSTEVKELESELETKVHLLLRQVSQLQAQKVGLAKDLKSFQSHTAS